MKGIFDAYLLWPFGKKFIFELVMRVRTRDFTVVENPPNVHKSINLVKISQPSNFSMNLLPSKCIKELADMAGKQKIHIKNVLVCQMTKRKLKKKTI